MGKAWTPWREGRRAWGRLEAWVPGNPAARSSAEGDGEGALVALADIGLVRRLLDQAELAAVRAARIHGKSWAEIATRLGVTRQSAWERWRELEETPPESGREVALRVASEVATELSESARQARRRSAVRVPNVVGMSLENARKTLMESDLIVVNPDPDAPPLILFGASGVVVDQSPESGAMVPAGTHVRLWVEGDGGGSAGVREPRRPSPDPKSAREVLYEPSDEGVG